MRAIGIPTRSVTNFESAHDTDASMTIDFHWNESDDPVEDLNDSTWFSYFCITQTGVQGVNFNTSQPVKICCHLKWCNEIQQCLNNTVKVISSKDLQS